MDRDELYKEIEIICDDYYYSCYECPLRKYNVSKMTDEELRELLERIKEEYF